MEEWSLLRGFIWLKTTFICNLAHIRGEGETIYCTDNLNGLGRTCLIKHSLINSFLIEIVDGNIKSMITNCIMLHCCDNFDILVLINQYKDITFC